jgi:hypothetical protein
MKKLRLRHPILSQISFHSFKYLIECSYLMKGGKGDVIIKEGSRFGNILLVLYG